MTAYATVSDVQERMSRPMSDNEQAVCGKLLEDAAAIIDSMCTTDDVNAVDMKAVVSCRMVIRAIGDGGDSGVPIGANQGSQSALGYSQSWTFSSGGNGELYLTKVEKQMLGIGNRIGSYSPVQELVPEVSYE